MGGVVKSVGGIVDSVTGSKIFGDSAEDRAISAQQGATARANDVSKYIFDMQRADQEPWRATGAKALAGLDNPDFQRDFTMSDFAADPGYQFRMAEGMKALQRSAAARGSLNSGATLKSLLRYGQDYGAGEYQNAYNRFNADRDRRFNRMSSLAGLGQTATNQLGNFASQYGQQVGSNLIGMGNAIGAANIAAGNREAQQVNSLISGAATYLGAKK